MAKKAKKPMKLWIARGKEDDESNYYFLAGERKQLHQIRTYGWWYADRGASAITMCARDFELACPHLKLKPGDIRQLAPPQWAKKRKAER